MDDGFSLSVDRSHSLSVSCSQSPHQENESLVFFFLLKFLKRTFCLPDKGLLVALQLFQQSRGRLQSFPNLSQTVFPSAPPLCARLKYLQQGQQLCSTCFFTIVHWWGQALWRRCLYAFVCLCVLFFSI